MCEESESENLSRRANNLFQRVGENKQGNTVVLFVNLMHLKFFGNHKQWYQFHTITVQSLSEPV